MSENNSEGGDFPRIIVIACSYFFHSKVIKVFKIPKCQFPRFSRFPREGGNPEKLFDNFF